MAPFTSDLGVLPGCLGGSTRVSPTLPGGILSYLVLGIPFQSWRPLDRYSRPPPPLSPSDDLRPPSSYHRRGVTEGQSILTWHQVLVGEEEGGAGQEWQACPLLSPYRGAMLDTYTLSVVVVELPPPTVLIFGLETPGALLHASFSADLKPPSYRGRRVAAGCRVGDEEGGAVHKWTVRGVRKRGCIGDCFQYWQLVSTFDLKINLLRSATLSTPLSSKHVRNHQMLLLAALQIIDGRMHCKHFLGSYVHDTQHLAMNVDHHLTEMAQIFLAMGDDFLGLAFKCHLCPNILFHVASGLVSVSPTLLFGPCQNFPATTNISTSVALPLVQVHVTKMHHRKLMTNRKTSPLTNLTTSQYLRRVQSDAVPSLAMVTPVLAAKLSLLMYLRMCLLFPQTRAWNMTKHRQQLEDKYLVVPVEVQPANTNCPLKKKG
ncbi:hypothetical protein EDB83DRAFT_2320289 [Lactarius deliciosus]|nr:hypothetical protein EDB83DRAFT_2320289 [Lactarius deliciosus]